MMKMSKKIEGENFQGDPEVFVFSNNAEDAKKHITVYATRYGLVSSEIRIAFDRTAVCNLDIVDALSDKRLRKTLEELGLCGNALPTRLTETERLALYDHRHDEIFNENDNEKRKR